MENNTPVSNSPVSGPQAPHSHGSYAAQGYPSHMTVMHQPGPPKGMSVASMVIGLVNIVFGWTFVLPIVGLILGIVGYRKEPAGRGMAITGIILSGLLVIGWLLLILMMMGVFAAAGTSAQ